MTAPSVRSATSVSAPAVALSAASIRRGGRLVLEEVRLTVGRGEFVAVLGPNGAGKSTLLQALLGLVPLADGHATVLGAPAGAHNRDVACVITRCFFLLIGSLVFFINDDQAKILQWSEDRAARANNDFGASGMNLMPLIVPFTFGQMTVQYSDDVGHLRKTAFEALNCLRR